MKKTRMMATNPSWVLVPQQRPSLKGLRIFGAEEETGNQWNQWGRLALPVTAAQTLLASSSAEEKKESRKDLSVFLSR